MMIVTIHDDVSKNITGYQRDLMKIRADYATSLHCDIFTTGCIKKTHHSEFSLKSVPGVSGVFQNQNFEPETSRHFNHTHQEY